MIVRCLACGSNIRYDIALGRLYCEACGQSFMPEEFEDEEGTFDAVSYTCQSCGAQLITTDDTEATAFCSFCGSTSILTGKINNIKKPDGILPFKITKEQCREIYLERAKQAFFVPDELTSNECIDSFRAIYMPYWALKIKAKGKLSRKTLSSTRDGDYIIQKRQTFESDKFNAEVAEYIHDASKDFSDDISEAIRYGEEEQKEIVPFQPAYLSGFYADMATQVAKNHKENAKAAAYAEMGPDFSGTIEIKDHKLNYIPVWFMSMKYKNKLTYAAINGYTGKIVADFPISIPKFLLGIGAVSAALFPLISLLFVLRPEPAFFLSLVFALVGLVLCTIERKKYIPLFDRLGLHHAGNTMSETIVCCFLICIACVLALTKANAAIYASVFLLVSVLIYQCVKTFRIHQTIAQRRPPQFNRKTNY